MKYLDFLSKKQISDTPTGFDSKIKYTSKLFDWQKIIIQWALKRGRAAIFADCGLGKTIMQLEWSKHIIRHTKRPILILAPLAVSKQTKLEGEKFGIKVNICSSESDSISYGINITNYEKLHKFNPSNYVGVVLDESSILKNFNGVRRNEIIDAFTHTPYKLACTATPAPNDFEELGNHAEFLGIMSREEMLSMFFINDTAHTGTWRLKGHVRDNLFWKWMASWAIMLSSPSDIGFSNDGFIIPKINYYEHIIQPKGIPTKGLFFREAKTLNDRRKVRKNTIELRVNKAAELINKEDKKWIIWCNLNEEGDCLEKKIADSIQVAGRHNNDLKSQRMLDFAKGKINRLITKPKIAGLGMNWQVCNNAAFIGLSDSWEQFYQAVRRIWRFGQKKEVHVHIFIEKREGAVLKNIQRKDKQAKTMIKNMILHMKGLTEKELKQANKDKTEYNPTVIMELPRWVE